MNKIPKQRALVKSEKKKNKHGGVLGLILARGGSKGIPRKNIVSLGGKPLIAWTIESAKQSQVITRVVLSSDDDETINVARKYGCDVPFRRPKRLATDSASTIDTVIHALDKLSTYDYVVLLQPTSPLRTPVDIDAAFQLMLENNSPSCVSISEAEQSPYWMYRRTETCTISPILPNVPQIARRQELPPVYILNGAIYVAEVEWLKQNMSFLHEETVGYIMPNTRSIDIDTKSDLELCETYLKALTPRRSVARNL
jgi:CMP-N,N'-diacetyllegionaminic acid synthase